MTSKLKEISKKSINHNLMHKVIFNSINSSFCYELDIDGLIYYFCTKSNIVKPVIQNSKNEKFVLLGVDLNIVFFNKEYKNIVLSIGLQNHFKYFIDLSTSIIVVTDTCIIQISLDSFVVHPTDFPDIITEIKIKNNIIEIQCMNDDNYRLEICFT